MTDQLSKCTSCGTVYPRAPIGRIHKCGKCSGGICQPIPAEQPTDATLLPCPFCGSHDVELRQSITDAMVACNNCGCRTGFVFFGASEAANAAKIRELTAVWNTRTMQAAAPTPNGEGVPDWMATPDDETDYIPTPINSEGLDALVEIAAERKRQIEAEGWTPEHDDGHDENQLAYAAACYAVGMPMDGYWSWDLKWWKPGPDRRRRLIKAGALLVAEIERIDRAALEAVRAGDGR